MAERLPAPFVWGDITLSAVVHIDGIPYVTKTAIGEWLEYADPRDAVNKIVERNEHLRDHATAVKLTAVDGKNRDTEVYHPIGFLLIVMESGQPKAHQMKRAVAEFVWAFAGPRTMPERERVGLMKLRQQYVLHLANCRDAFTREVLLADLRDVSLRLGQPVPDVALLGKDPNQIALRGV